MRHTWVDTHVHLDRYELAERAAIVARASDAGVAILAVAVDLASSRAVVELDGTAGCAVGVHPLYGAELDAGVLRELARMPGVVAIGECGFDGAGPEWDAQASAFRGQCALARKAGLTVILHIDGAGAWGRLAENEDALEGLRVVRHYFTGDAAQAEWHAERGHFVSFGRPLLREHWLQAVCREYPAGLILVETDSYPLAGRTTEPRDVVAVGEAASRLRGWTLGEGRERLFENSLAAFPGSRFG
ncbi:MAG: TatD family hydrolase [Dehalococcoidia bacterium]|nr:TatD family hydrolase [Dehalococcoidia bacterium]